MHQTDETRSRMVIHIMAVEINKTVIPQFVVGTGIRCRRIAIRMPRIKCGIFHPKKPYPIDKDWLAASTARLLPVCRKSLNLEPVNCLAFLHFEQDGLTQVRVISKRISYGYHRRRVGRQHNAGARPVTDCHLPDAGFDFLDRIANHLILIESQLLAVEKENIELITLYFQFIAAIGARKSHCSPSMSVKFQIANHRAVLEKQMLSGCGF